MCKTYQFNSRLKKFAIAESRLNDYIKDVKNETSPVDQTPGAGRFAMELISDGPMETSASSSEGVTLHLSELADMDKYSVIYEIARIQTLISSLSSDNCRSAA